MQRNTCHQCVAKKNLVLHFGDQGMETCSLDAALVSATVCNPFAFYEDLYLMLRGYEAMQSFTLLGHVTLCVSSRSCENY